MARITAPAKNDMFTLLLGASAVVFLIGFLVNSQKLSDYKGGAIPTLQAFNPAAAPAAGTKTGEAVEGSEAPASTGEEKAAPAEGEAATENQPAAGSTDAGAAGGTEE